MPASPDVSATCCATLVDEWCAAGVTDVVVCPGSRSTPLALAVAADDRLRTHVHLDERSAGFTALGLGLASARPAVVITTSGTAAAELLPAVVEAHQGCVPLIVATADRPPELRDVGAAQTIDQMHLYGGAVRWFAEPGVPDDATAATWRTLAARSMAEATGIRPGPVHLNLAFREPLVGEPGPLPVRPGSARGWVDRSGPPRPSDASLLALRELTRHERGMIVAGRGAGHPDAVHALAHALAWPLLADPRSGARYAGPATVSAADSLLRHAATAERLRPSVVLRLGEPPVSKAVNTFLDSSGAQQVLIDTAGRWLDPGHRLTGLVAAEPGAVAAAIASGIGPDAPPRSPTWLAAWVAVEAAAQQSIDDVLSEHDEPTEPGIARAVVAALPEGTTLVASSSMPVRDVEWWGAPRQGVRVLANRGANGIDGVTSTAVGVALAGGPTALLIGDVAFLHDTNGLLGLARRDVDLTIVVVDNDGGGIFSFLPQRAQVDPARFELLFGTPHGVDLGALAAVHGLDVARPASAVEVGPAVAGSMAAGGTRVVHVRTDRDANVAVHAEIHAAVGAALDALG